MSGNGCEKDVLRAGSGEPARREGNAAMRKIDIETLKAFVEDYERLKKIARSLHRYYEIHCERSLTEREERRMEKLEAEAKEIAARWGLCIDFCSDPRGAPICLHDDAEALRSWRYSGLVVR